MKEVCFKGGDKDGKVTKKREDNERHAGTSNCDINYRGGRVVGCNRDLWKVTYVIVFDRCSHRRANPVYHSNQESVVLQLQHTIYNYYYL